MIKDITLILCVAFWFIFTIGVSSSRHIYIRFYEDNLTVSHWEVNGALSKLSEL
jgi:hypothetical protein